MTRARWAAGWLAPLALGAVLTLVYVATLLPATGVFGDTSLYQFQGPLLGLNLTGYPQYTLATFLFGWLWPAGSLAWRVSLFSAVCAVGACLVVYALLRRLAVGRGLAGLSALTFGLSLTFWSQAVIAEVYALNALWVAVVLLAWLRWAEQPDEGRLFDAGLAYAFSFGNHLTMVTLAPALAFLLWHRAPQGMLLRGRTWLGLACCAVIGLAQYAYVFWRTLDPETAYLSLVCDDPATFFRAVTGGGTELQGLMVAHPWQRVVFGEGWGYVKHLLREFYVLPMALIAWGAGVRPGWRAAFLALAFLGELFFALNYAIPDIRFYYIPTFLIATVWLGLGAQDLLGRWPALSRGWWWLGLLPAAMLVGNFAPNDRSRDDAMDRRVQATLAAVGGNALIVTPEYTETMAFTYHLLAEGWQARNIWRWDSGAGFRQDVRPVVMYLQRGAPLQVPQQRRVVPAGLAVYCTSADQVAAFASLGVRCERVAPDVWRVGRWAKP
ncbi:MAG: DUF2723 domain-containing protein [Candidatus Sericytochromatia bacterium]|nr:DUF2723 domain-containing protein [Candidatus Sericytochromatia bacterium]